MILVFHFGLKLINDEDCFGLYEKYVDLLMGVVEMEKQIEFCG